MNTRSTVASPAVASGADLGLLRETKLASLIAPVAPDADRLEASGVVLQDDRLWVIFDNLPHIIAIDPTLVPGPGAAHVVRQDGPAAGYEDIARDEVTGRRFVLIESAPYPGGGFRPQIDEFDAHWRRVVRRWVELELHRPNKGLEGLDCVHRDGQRFLLALSEGNGGRGGPAGRRPGKGTVHVLTERGDTWVVIDRIRLPVDLPFVDYSGLSVRENRIAVISQESSALWVGRLDPHHWRITDGGTVHPFPRDHKGRVRYRTVEGVTWLDDSTVAAVSDRARGKHGRRARATAESVHVFAVPQT